MTDRTGLREVPLDLAAWGLGGGDHALTEHLGRPCIRFGDTNLAPVLRDIVQDDGVIEVDLAVARERSFHGLIWRVRDAENFESFFVRPHQVGNPDSIQYTPVTNDISSWQLYHGPGFWAPVAFPIDAWFTIRVKFAGSRAEVFVGDRPSPALRIAELKRPAAPGGIGLLVGGPGLRVARFAYTGERPRLGEPPPREDEPHPGVIRDWDVSDPFPEAEVARADRLPPDLLAARTWTPFVAERSGLLDLSRAHGIREGRNTVLARTAIRAARARVVPLEIGFSDRAVVFLNGRALFRGDDTYRSRDYRFLGSIGFWDTVYLPLDVGDNELVVAVAEDFGGWGIQARFAEGAD